MIYSRVYKSHYPIQHGVDIAMLEERERERLAKCIRKFPRSLTAWCIECMRHSDPKKLDQYHIGEDLALVRKECGEIADKVMAGHILSDEEVKSVNVALCADKYNWFFSAIIPSITHLERLSSMEKQRKRNESR